MNVNKKMSCCYFPSTTVMVDDDPAFSNPVSTKISRFSACKAFSYPAEALEYINHTYEMKPFCNQFFIPPKQDENRRNHCTISVDFTSIHKQIYNPNRFSEITGLLVDYAMPGLNGREFCERALASCDWRNWNNIILLTGEASLDTVANMVKDGLINRYIYKREKDYLNTLTQTIKNRQLDYFEQYSSLFINMIAENMLIQGYRPSCLTDPVFIDFFHKMIDLHQPTEYYLINDSGTYLFLDSEGKLSWLIVQSEDDMEDSEFEMNMDKTVPPEVLNAIKERKALRYFFNEENFPLVEESSEWKKYICPAEIIKGKHANYYYSFVTKPLTKTFVDTTKISSYENFLSQL